MKNKRINEARNVWDQVLQRVDQYIHMELMLQSNVGGARQIFERFVGCHPKLSAWIRFPKFQTTNEEKCTSLLPVTYPK